MVVFYILAPIILLAIIMYTPGQVCTEDWTDADWEPITDERR